MSMSHTEAAAAQPQGNPGEILRLAREERGWQLAEVAAQLNLTSHSLSQLDTGDIELTLNEKSLIIRGAKKNEVGNYYRQERPTGSFQRIVNLNVPVQADGIKATMKDGLLRVVLPKARESRPLTISIDAQ